MESGTDAHIVITNLLDPNNEGDDFLIANAENSWRRSRRFVGSAAVAKCDKNKKYFLKKLLTNACESVIITKSQANAGMAQSVEHVIGNDEVISSILITSSRRSTVITVLFLFYLLQNRSLCVIIILSSSIR